MLAACKTWVKKGLVSTRLLSLCRRLLSARVVLLRYHSVTDDPAAREVIGPGIVHGADDFAAQMRWLATDYQPVTLDDVADALRAGRPLPDRGVLVTFDDGYRDNHAVAMPILDDCGIKGVFYVTVDCVERQAPPWFCRLKRAFAASPRLDDNQRARAYAAAAERCTGLAGEAQLAFLDETERALDAPPFAPPGRLMMTWDEVRDLHRRGHTVGSHTLSHPNVAQAAPEDQRRELVESKRRLEEELGTPVRHFSYPSPRLQPHWTAATVAVCAEAGYETAVTTTPGPVVGSDSPLSLTRFPVPQAVDAFRWTVQCAFLGRYA